MSKSKRTSCPASSRFRKGASLLEVLVALGIVVAISAVVVPWSFGWLGGRELDSAEDRLAMQLMMARAAAREKGRPVEIVAGSRGVEARWLEDASEESYDGEADGRADGRSLFRESPESGRGFRASINAEWAVFELPDGVAIDLAQSSDADGADVPDATDLDRVASDSKAAGARGSANGGAGGGSDGAPQTLAIFLPDGTVIMAPVFLIRTDAGAVRRMRIDAATGRPKAVESMPVPATGFDRPEFDSDFVPAPTPDARSPR